MNGWAGGGGVSPLAASPAVRIDKARNHRIKLLAWQKSNNKTF
jgi:hypothetical protein